VGENHTLHVKSHSASKNCTLHVEITLVRVKITLVRFDITLLRVVIADPFLFCFLGRRGRGLMTLISQKHKNTKKEQIQVQYRNGAKYLLFLKKIRNKS
jgi:hypothetical protein